MGSFSDGVEKRRRVRMQAELEKGWNANCAGDFPSVLDFSLLTLYRHHKFEGCSIYKSLHILVQIL